MNPYSPLLGCHVGACHNRNMNVSDNFVMTIYGVKDRIVHGDLSLAGVLSGGGPLRGTVNKNRISFTTSNPAHQVLIKWTGVINYGSLFGSYSVRCDYPGLEPQMRRQQGVWNCKLVRGLVSTNPEPAPDIRIYHGENEEGPFTQDEFVSGLDSHRWPANGIVGTTVNGLTNWKTVAECFELLKQEDAATN